MEGFVYYEISPAVVLFAAKNRKKGWRMIDTIGYRSSHDIPKERKKYLPLIQAHLRGQTAGKFQYEEGGSGSHNGVKVRLLPNEAKGELVIRISEAGTWHIFTLKTKIPREPAEEFKTWCRANIHHAQIIWK
jgi:hypothetical protein